MNISKEGFNKFLFLSTFQGIQFILNFFCSAYFSRIISPQILGIWCTFSFCFSLYFAFIDLGVESSLFFKVTKEYDATAFCSIFFFRFFFCLIPFFIAFFSILFFDFSQKYIFFLFSLFFVLEKISNIFRFWMDSLQEQMRQTTIDFFGQLLANSCALIFTIWGNYSFILPLQKIGEKFFIILFSYSKIPNINVLRFDFNIIKQSIKTFGIATLRSNLAGIFLYEFYPFLLAIMLGFDSAGIFAKSFSLATLPLLLTTVCNRITTPIYGTMQETYDCKRIFLMSLFVKILVLIPALIFLAFFADRWIPILLGGQWLSVIGCYRILCFYSFGRALYDDIGPLFNLALKQPLVFAQYQLFQAFLVLFFMPVIFFTKSLKVTCIIASIIMLTTFFKIFYKICEIMFIDSNDFKNIFSKKFWWGDKHEEYKNIID